MAEFEHNSEKFGYLNLEDFEHVQKALAALGYDPGKIDGLDGPNTKKAVREFQASANIGVDGIVGRDTRTALVQRLDQEANRPETPEQTS